jgi:chromate transporter
MAVMALYLAGANVTALLFGGGLIVTLTANFQRLRGQSLSLSLGPPCRAEALRPVVVLFSLPLLFLTFLKIGPALYGSGYVLPAFLRADFVVKLGWLTDQQFIVAITIGQVTSGLVFTTATFIGFILGGLLGALLATLGIFLLSFIFVAISNPLISLVRNS